MKKGVFKSFAKFAGKHLCQSLLFNKVAGHRSVFRCFPVNFAKFKRTSFLQNTSGRLLLCHWFPKEIRDYFSELVELLATNIGLTECFQKTIEETVSKFETKFEEENRKNDELESRIAVQEQTINGLLIKCDDRKQCSRCNCLRIQSIKNNITKTTKIHRKTKLILQNFEFTFGKDNIVQDIGSVRSTQIKIQGRKQNL